MRTFSQKNQSMKFWIFYFFLLFLKKSAHLKIINYFHKISHFAPKSQIITPSTFLKSGGVFINPHFDSRTRLQPWSRTTTVRNVLQDAKEFVRQATRMLFRQVIRLVSRQMIRKVFRQVIRFVFLVFFGWKIPLAKVVDFDPLGALSGPGAPDPDVALFQLSLSMEFLIFR